MRTSDFDYVLPPELIAQEPVYPRDSSRLLVVHRNSGALEHRNFTDILEYLKNDDCLVVNETRVIPARLIGHKKTGGKVEIFLLRKRCAPSSGLPLRSVVYRQDLRRPSSPRRGEGGHCRDVEWEALVKPGARVAPGTEVELADGAKAIVGERLDGGKRLVTFSYSGSFDEMLARDGEVPLPPYIHTSLADSERYQTVYAKKEGSVAAPTAGLHFTPELLERIGKQGVSMAKATLDVGIGTFQPVRADIVEEHTMHEERFEIDARAADMIDGARDKGGRIVAVGTTSVRVLESTADSDGRVKETAGETDLFIYPGYTFKAVDAMVTNFHLPRSSLLMLVCAFAGRELIMKAYEEAVNRRYRFFSFGDAMLIV